MRNITVDIEQAKIEDLAVLINEITEDIKKSKGAALEDLDKKKTWRQKFHEFCKFSKGNQKVVLKDTLEDVRDTNVLLQLLTALSKKIYEEHNEVLIEVIKNLEDLYSDIKDINDFKEELKKEVQEEIKELKEFHTNKLNIRNRSNLADENINLLLSTISFIYHLKEEHSKIEQEYLESIKIFFNRGSYDIEDINIDNNNISQIEHKQAEIFYAFVLEAIAILYNEDKSNPVSITTINSDIISYILDEIGLAGSIKKKIESDVNKELNDYSKIDIHFVKKYEKHIDNEDFLLDDFAFVIDENDFFVDIDDSNEQEENDNNNNDETKKTTTTEQYDGIPLKTIETLKPFSSCGCFETKDYFIVGKKDYSQNSVVWNCFDKKEKNTKILKSILNRWNLNLDFRDFGKNYIVDYNNNFLYLVYQKSLHVFDLKHDFHTTYATGEIDCDISSIQSHGNWIVMSAYEKLYYFDIENRELHKLSDAICNDINHTVSKSTVFENIIYFYSSDGYKLCDENGVSLENSICIYDIKNRSLKKIIDASVIQIFTIFNQVYVIKYSDSSFYRYEICKLEKNGNQYQLNKVIDIPSGCDIVISENYLICYYNYSDNEKYSIYAFDFRTQTYEKVVNDCFRYYDDGIFKSKWRKLPSYYKVYGNWIYYYKDQIMWQSHGKDSKEEHIYRTNIKFPLQAVDIGNSHEYK